MIVADNEQALERAAHIINSGGIVAFRTDTFYGLGANPLNPDALRVIQGLKGREAGKPILVVISDADVAARLMAERSEVFDFVCAKHWPGPLTLVVRAREEVPAELTAGTGTIGLRLPADESVRAVIRACGGALTATSANLSGEPPARNAREVSRSFPVGLDLIIDGGESRSEQPSTVLDVSQDEPRLIREGVLSKQDLGRTLAAFGLSLGGRSE